MKEEKKIDEQKQIINILHLNSFEIGMNHYYALYLVEKGKKNIVIKANVKLKPFKCSCVLNSIDLKDL